MTFMAHGLLGAGLCALPFRWSRPLLRCGATIAGAIGGIGPDIGTLFGVKEQLHEMVCLSIHPAYGLHLWLDSYAHQYADWWEMYWYLEVLCWIVGGLSLWVAWGKQTG
jgi:hypothetical protein